MSSKNYCVSWESNLASQTEYFTRKEDALLHAEHLVSHDSVLYVATFDLDRMAFAVLKGRLPASMARAIPTQKTMSLTRRELLLLERILPNVIEGTWLDSDDETAGKLLSKVQVARGRLDREAAFQRRINETARGEKP